MRLAVYSKNNCPACVKLKESLIKRGIPFEEANIDENPLGKLWLISEGYRSVPQIFDLDDNDRNVTKEYI